MEIEAVCTPALLIEVSHEFADGRKRKVNRLVGTKRRPDENSFGTARRVLNTFLQIEEPFHNFKFSKSSDIVEESTVSPSYPGLFTTYRKHYINVVCTRSGSSNANLEQIGIDVLSKKTQTAKFSTNHHFTKPSTASSRFIFESPSMDQIMKNNSDSCTSPLSKAGLVVPHCSSDGKKVNNSGLPDSNQENTAQETEQILSVQKAYSTSVKNCQTSEFEC